MLKKSSQPADENLILKKTREAQNAALLEVEKLEAKGRKLADEMSGIEGNKNTLTIEKEFLEKRIEDLQVQAVALENSKGEALQETNKAIKKAQTVKIEEEAELDSLQSKKTSVTEELKRTHQALKDVQIKVNKEAENSQILKKQTESIEERRKEVQQKAEKELKEILEHEKELEAMIEGQNKKITDLKQEIQRTELILEQERRNKVRAIHERAEIEKEVEKMKKQLADLKEEIRIGEERLEEVTMIRLQRQKEIDSIERRKDELRTYYEKAGLKLNI